MLTSVDQQNRGQAKQRIIRSADQRLPSDMLKKKIYSKKGLLILTLNLQKTKTEISISATTQPILNL